MKTLIVSTRLLSQSFCLATLLLHKRVSGFTVPHTLHRRTSSSSNSNGPSSTLWMSTAERSPSRVEDPDGPTPQMGMEDPPEIDPEDVEELREIHSAKDLPHPIPHQPWRRGDTAGCEAPISAEWRQEAESIIYNAVKLVGGEVLDVTWFLTTVLVTIDEDVMPMRDFAKDTGPVMNVMSPRDPLFKDPEDPEPEPIWDDEEDIAYQRETEEEAAEAKEMLINKYAPKDSDDPPDEPHIPVEEDQLEVPLYKNVESRQEVAMKAAEEQEFRESMAEKPFELHTIKIDKAALSTIAHAILEALKEHEDELEILSRHELVMTSPGPPEVIETQKQFDAHVGSNVIVETQDPFESNRTLKGKIVDRNSMDLIINKQGRMVTIPHNFVKCVRLPRIKKSE